MHPKFAPMEQILDPGTGGGGGGGQSYDFRAALPEDIRKDPVFDSIKGKDANEVIALMGKNYVHAQRMIGSKRLEVPQKDWSPEKWSAFNAALGVPDKPEGYQIPEYKFHEGLQLQQEKLDGYRKLFKEIGLRPDQSDRLLKAYFDDVNGAYGSRNSEIATARQTGIAKLKEMYGENYDAKLDIGRAVMKKYAPEGLLSRMQERGLDSDPEMIDFIIKVGEQLSEDSPIGNGPQLRLGGRAAAMQEINSLKIDKEFQAALNNARDPGHKAAVEKWLGLFQVAYPKDKAAGE